MIGPTAVIGSSAVTGLTALLADTSPGTSPSPGSGVTGASAAWAPTAPQLWVFGLVFLVLTALWGSLVTYNLLAGGRALRRTQEVLGMRPMKSNVVGRVQSFERRDTTTLTEREMGLLSEATQNASMGSTRLTRTLLALLTFSLIAALVVVVFTEDSADDLRKQIATALLTFLATIGGFYFGSDAAHKDGDHASTQAPVATPAQVLDGNGPGAHPVAD